MDQQCYQTYLNMFLMNIIMAASKAKTGKKCGKTRQTKSKELAMRNMFWMNISRVIGTRTSTVIKIMLELKSKLNLTYDEMGITALYNKSSYVHDVPLLNLQLPIYLANNIHQVKGVLLTSKHWYLSWDETAMLYYYRKLSFIKSKVKQKIKAFTSTSQIHFHLSKI